jgi:hypothetical protein
MSRFSVVAAAVGSVLALMLFVKPASADPGSSKKGGTCAAYTVVVNGQAFSGDQRRTIPPPISSISVRGTYNRFEVVPSTFATLNYTWTGVPTPRQDKNLPGAGEGPQVIFESKVPNHGDTLNGPLQLDISAEGVVLERAGARQDMKIQAKDCHQGGVFQMEPEPGTTFTHTLGPRFHYTGQPPGETRLCFTNRAFSGYDSPELAALVSFTPTTSTWNVQSGGRMGMVIGEDAIEGGCLP